MRDRESNEQNMAAELGKMEPPFSLQSMDRTGSPDPDIDLVADEEDEEHEHKGVFVLREKRGVIYPLDYKYRVGKFNLIIVILCSLHTHH